MASGLPGSARPDKARSGSPGAGALYCCVAAPALGGRPSCAVMDLSSPAPAPGPAPTSRRKRRGRRGRAIPHPGYRSARTPSLASTGTGVPSRAFTCPVVRRSRTRAARVSGVALNTSAQPNMTTDPSLRSGRSAKNSVTTFSPALVAASDISLPARVNTARLSSNSATACTTALAMRPSSRVAM